MKKMNFIESAVFQRAKLGNSCNGDSYFCMESNNKFICVIADGLGSGSLAKESSNLAIDSIKKSLEISHDIDYLLQECNKKLFKMRGVVIGILIIDVNDYSYSLTSIGNVRIISISPEGEHKKHIPTYGYLPEMAQTYKISTGKCKPGQLFFMFSDGIDESKLLFNSEYFRDISKLVHYYESSYEQLGSDDSTLIALKCSFSKQSEHYF